LGLAELPLSLGAPASPFTVSVIVSPFRNPPRSLPGPL
jgi:hypothetical protein